MLAMFNQLQAQTNIWSDNFESYEGTGSIPASFGGGMRVYSSHGTTNSKALCIQFSPFKSADSTITPALGPITPEVVSHLTTDLYPTSLEPHLMVTQLIPIKWKFLPQ